MKRELKLWKRADVRIRMLCRKLTEKQRVTVVVTAFALFTASCLYMVFSSLSEFGRSDEGMEIEHICPLELEKPGKQKDYRNIHFKDIQDYGPTENQDTVRILG